MFVHLMDSGVQQAIFDNRTILRNKTGVGRSTPRVTTRFCTRNFFNRIHDNIPPWVVDGHKARRIAPDIHFVIRINGVKNALADGVLERYGVDAPEVIKEAFGAMGHRGGGRFFKFDEGEDPRIAELQKQLEEAQQALAQKTPPELIAAEVEEIKAKTRLVDAQIQKTRAETTTKNVEGMFSATSAANQIALQPTIAPLADQLLKSAGFQDADLPPIVPEVAPGVQGVAGLPQNTSPNFPPNPDVGMNAGIETVA